MNLTEKMMVHLRKLAQVNAELLWMYAFSSVLPL